MKRDIEMMRLLLIMCRRYAIHDESEAWDWYSVFCEAWNRLGKSRIEGVEGCEALKDDLRRTQQRLREMKEKKEAGHSQQEGAGI
jgi:hypothetical protein